MEKSPTIGLYAGSFDPFHIGHLDIVKRASLLFDYVVVGMGVNPEKTRRYDKERMREAIEATLKREKLYNVVVTIYEGFTVDEALACSAKYLIRGLRNEDDYKYEEESALFNENLSPKVETVFFRAVKYSDVSSSRIAKLLCNGYDVSKYLPLEVAEIVCPATKKD